MIIYEDRIPYPFDLLALITILKLKTAPIGAGGQDFRASCLTCFQVKLNFIFWQLLKLITT